MSSGTQLEPVGWLICGYKEVKFKLNHSTVLEETEVLPHHKNLQVKNTVPDQEAASQMGASAEHTLKRSMRTCREKCRPRGKGFEKVAPHPRGLSGMRVSSRGGFSSEGFCPSPAFPLKTKCYGDPPILWGFSRSLKISRPHLKSSEIMPFAATWIYLEMITLGEGNQTKKDKCHTSRICGILKK